MVKALKNPFFWLCTGICVRIVYAWAFGDPLAASDAPGYYADALHLLRGETYIPQFPPGLPLLLAGWMAVFGTGKIALTACMIAVYAAFGLGLMRLVNPYLCNENLAEASKPLPPAWFDTASLLTTDSSPRKGGQGVRPFRGLFAVGSRLHSASGRVKPPSSGKGGGRGSTWLPMLLFALFPAAIHQSIAPLTHLLLAAYLIWAWDASGDRKRPWLAGLMVGFAVLVRPASALAGLVVAWRLSSFGDGPALRQAQRPGPAQDDSAKASPIGPMERSAGPENVMLSRPGGPSPKHDVFRFLLPALALPALWLAFTALTLGRPVLNEYNAYNFFLGNNPYTPIYKTWWLGSHEAIDSVGFAQYTASLHPGGTPTPDDYSHAAWQHIADRPDLFVIRTLARMRTLLAFDTLAAGDWRDRHPGSRFYLVLLAADALIGIGILLFGGLGLIGMLDTRVYPYPQPPSPRKGAFRAKGRTVLLKICDRKSRKGHTHWHPFLGEGAGGRGNLAMLLALAAPYWLAFSHPTYHLPMLPFLALFVAEGVSKLLSMKWLREHPRLALAGGVYALALLTIQVEWVLRR